MRRRLVFFRNIPPEIIIDILSRLPIKTILSCKCVCKSWLDLIESPVFPELHLSKSVAGLAVCQHEVPVSKGKGPPKPYKILEFVDELGANIVISRFDFPYDARIHSSVNGLLCMHDVESSWPDNFYICNPITREYFKLPPRPKKDFDTQTFGFGVSKTTGQYKLVNVLQIHSFAYRYVTLAHTECLTYTLGTGSWRSIRADNSLDYGGGDQVGLFLNGNLHWLASDSKDQQRISCFDLETELFITFASPPNRPYDPLFSCFSAFGDCLCFCDNLESEIVVWLMKEYGDEKSWTNEYSIKKPSGRGLWGYNFLVKVSKDGGILILDEINIGGICDSNWSRSIGVICYLNKSITIPETVAFGFGDYSKTSYTPSFLSLKMFGIEDVRSL